MHRTDTTVVLRTEGVTAILDVTDGRAPALVHWGVDLGDRLTAEDVAALVRAGVNPPLSSTVDEPLRVALVAEAWTGWTGRPGLIGAHDGRHFSPRFTATAVRVDGEPVNDPLVSLGPGLVEVECTDRASGLDLVVSVELLPGGLLRARAAVVNTADQEYRLDALSVAFPVPSHAAEILDFGGRWGRERAAQRRRMVTGTHLREGRHGRTGHDAATVLHLGTPGFGFADGEVWGVHTAWSGNHVHYAELLSSGEQVMGGGELLLPGEVVLGRGERYASPWLYGSHGTGLDEVAGRFHTYLRSRPGHPSIRRPVTINVWEAVYLDHDLGALTALADLAASVGAERYVLDDGWFGARRDDTRGLGDWVVSPEVWPDGLHPLVDHVTGLGLEFGLWVEPEMVNVDSDLARAHPEWVMAPAPDRLPREARSQQVLDLGIPQCYDHIRDALVTLLDEYDISSLKWDHNRDLLESGSSDTGGPGVHRQTVAVYRLLDELRARYPALEVESCSSGGGRVDLEVLQRTDRVWVSDCIDPHERQLMHRWTSQLLPLELMGSHVASHTSHTTGRRHDLGFRCATAVFGHLGIEWDLREASDQDLDELRQWVAFHVEQRDLLFTGRLVRMDVADDGVVGTGVVASDGSVALYSVASLGRTPVATLGRIRLPGLDPDRTYRVAPVTVGAGPRGLVAPAWWGEDASGVRLSGRALAAVGLAQAPTHPDQAVLYRAEAVDGPGERP